MGDDESKTDIKTADIEQKSEHKEDNEDDDEVKYDKIDANIERAKMLKKKKVDFRAEMTSDSNEIDDLLKFEKKKNDKKSLEDLLAETDNMFKEIEDKEADDANAKDLDLDLNVDDDFNFDQYINQQDDGNDD